jgi:hypothetical protein
MAAPSVLITGNIGLFGTIHTYTTRVHQLSRVFFPVRAFKLHVQGQSGLFMHTRHLYVCVCVCELNYIKAQNSPGAKSRV